MMHLSQAWDLYYHVFKRINKQLPHLTTLDLGYVSPLLVSARNLELAVPGTYIAGETLVTIAAFAQKLQVRHLAVWAAVTGPRCTASHEAMAL
jgi:FKBP12-rapamycin complex-associated protein